MITNNRPTSGWILSATVFSLLLTGCKDFSDPIRYDEPPVSVAESLTFTDTVMGAGVGGRVVITRSPQDHDASSYVLRWGAGGQRATLPGGQSNYVGSVPVTQSNINALAIDFSVNGMPQGADSLMVFASNANGEAETGVSVLVENVYSHPLAPQTQPSSVSFYDNRYDLSVGGTVSLRIDSWDAGSYNWVLRYVGEDGCVLPGEPIRTFYIRSGYYGYNYRFYAYDVPREAKAFLITTHPKPSFKSLSGIGGVLSAT